jgi:metallo-beta-lactamase class B
MSPLENPMRPFLNTTLAAASAVAFLVSAAGAAARPGDTVHDRFTAASKAAGTEHVNLYNMLCPRLSDANAGKIATPPNHRAASMDGAVPFKVFDNLYYVGEKDFWESSASAWVIDTPEGIVLLEALYPDSGKVLIEAGMRKLGLDPARIKYVIVSHAHLDHFGAARYFQDKYKARVLMSEADWAMLEASRTPAAEKPTRDMVVADGQTLSLGGFTMTFYVTPGHTPGTLSILFPVTDRGQRHVVAEWGGTGFGFGGAQGADKVRWFETYNASAMRFRDLAAKAGADVLIANHPGLDRTYDKIAGLQARAAGGANPWVIGPQKVQDYVTTAGECAAAGARMD